jgi:hypothetical protein
VEADFGWLNRYGLKMKVKEQQESGFKSAVTEESQCPLFSFCEKIFSVS